jgi:hypothetical protein
MSNSGLLKRLACHCETKLAVEADRCHLCVQDNCEHIIMPCLDQQAPHQQTTHALPSTITTDCHASYAGAAIVANWQQSSGSNTGLLVKNNCVSGTPILRVPFKLFRDALLLHENGMP